MIRDLLNSAYIQKQKDFLTRVLQAEVERLKSSHPDALERASDNEVDLSDLEDALGWLERGEVDATGDEFVYIPCDGTLSILQSCLDKSFMTSGLMPKLDVSHLAEDERKFEPVSRLRLPKALAEPPVIDRAVAFEEGDPRYVSGYAMARAARVFRRKPTFVDRPSRVGIASEARIVLIGDWGSGIERAQMLAETVKKILKDAPERQGHVVHLGDVYFAGLEYEYTERVIPYWPGAVGRSWAIAGNHDLYSGGGPFFEMILNSATFAAQSKSSWFVLENEHWQFFGLDSSFQHPDAFGLVGDLAGSQGSQVHNIRREAPQKGGVLLTHHQPFTAVNEALQVSSPAMVDKLEPAIRDGLFRAWFWGHDHGCAVYHPWRTVEYPCLTGNGGIPTLHQYATPDAVVRWPWQDSISTPDGRYATLGFAVLDLSGDSMEVSFYNEYGKQQDLKERHIVRSQRAA